MISIEQEGAVRRLELMLGVQGVHGGPCARDLAPLTGDCVHYVPEYPVSPLSEQIPQGYDFEI